MSVPFRADARPHSTHSAVLAPPRTARTSESVAPARIAWHAWRYAVGIRAVPAHADRGGRRRGGGRGRSRARGRAARPGDRVRLAPSPRHGGTPARPGGLG